MTSRSGDSILIDGACLKDFIIRCLAHVSERSVRLHAYLAMVAAAAPQTGGVVPTVVVSMLADAETLAQDIRKRALQIVQMGSASQASLGLAYAATHHYVSRFVTLHGRLSHLPNEWVRSEVELFISSVGSAANGEVRKLLERGSTLLENYSIVTAIRSLEGSSLCRFYTEANS